MSCISLHNYTCHSSVPSLTWHDDSKYLDQYPRDWYVECYLFPKAICYILRFDYSMNFTPEKLLCMNGKKRCNGLERESLRNRHFCMCALVSAQNPIQLEKSFWSDDFSPSLHSTYHIRRCRMTLMSRKRFRVNPRIKAWCFLLHSVRC